MDNTDLVLVGIFLGGEIIRDILVSKFMVSGSILRLEKIADRQDTIGDRRASAFFCWVLCTTNHCTTTVGYVHVGQ